MKFIYSFVFLLLINSALFPQHREVDNTQAVSVNADTLNIARTDSISASEVIERYLQAIGGRDKLLSIQDRTIKMVGKVQKYEVTSILQQKYPNKYLSKFKYSGKEQTRLFDGEKAYIKTLMGNEELTGDDYALLKFQSDIAAMAHLNELNVLTNIVAVVTLGEKTAYKIELKIPDGPTIYQYYDIVSALKIQEEIPVTTLDMNFTLTIEYSDYREFEGLKYAYAIKQSFPNMIIQMNVTEIQVNTGIRDAVFK